VGIPGIYVPGIANNIDLQLALPEEFLLTVLSVRGSTAVVSASGLTFEVRSEIPLKTGQALYVSREQGAHEEIRLHVIGAVGGEDRSGIQPAAGEEQPDAQAAPGAPTLKQFDLLTALRLADLPVTTESMNSVKALLRLLGGLTPYNLLAAASLLKAGLTSRQLLEAVALFLQSLLEAPRERQEGSGGGDSRSWVLGSKFDDGGAEGCSRNDGGSINGGSVEGSGRDSGSVEGSGRDGGSVEGSGRDSGSVEGSGRDGGTGSGGASAIREAALARLPAMVELLQRLPELLGRGGGYSAAQAEARQVWGGQVYAWTQGDREKPCLYLPLFTFLHDHGLRGSELFIYPPAEEQQSGAGQGRWFFILTLETDALGWMRFNISYLQRSLAIQAVVERPGTKRLLDDNWRLLADGLGSLNLQLTSHNCEVGRVDCQAGRLQEIQRRFDGYNPCDVSI
jgi:hypothetical protein